MHRQDYIGTNDIKTNARKINIWIKRGTKDLGSQYNRSKLLAIVCEPFGLLFPGKPLLLPLMGVK